MDPNFYITKSVPSLQNLSAISLASHLLLKEKLSCDRDENLNVFTRAKKSISDLHYPLRLKTFLLHHLHKIYTNVATWKKKFGMGIKPVLSIAGTVDWCRSARVIVDDLRIGRYERFVVACVFCFEESVFKIGGQMTENERAIVESKLSPSLDRHLLSYRYSVSSIGLSFMSALYDSEAIYDFDHLLTAMTFKWFRAVLNGYRDHLTHGECMNALQLALRCNIGYEIKYFAEKVSAEECASCILKNDHYISMDRAMAYIDDKEKTPFYNWKRLPFRYMTPDTYILLLSKLCPTDQKRLMPIFALFVLNRIVDFPNTVIFKRAIFLFGPHLIPDIYWKLVLKAFTKLSSRKTRYEHFDILDDLWNLVANFDNISPNIRSSLRNSLEFIQSVVFSNNNINGLFSPSIVNCWMPLLRRYVIKISNLAGVSSP